MLVRSVDVGASRKRRCCCSRAASSSSSTAAAATTTSTTTTIFQLPTRSNKGNVRRLCVVSACNCHICVTRPERSNERTAPEAGGIFDAVLNNSRSSWSSTGRNSNGSNVLFGFARGAPVTRVLCNCIRLALQVARPCIHHCNHAVWPTAAHVAASCLIGGRVRRKRSFWMVIIPNFKLARRRWQRLWSAHHTALSGVFGDCVRRVFQIAGAGEKDCNRAVAVPCTVGTTFSCVVGACFCKNNVRMVIHSDFKVTAWRRGRYWRRRRRRRSSLWCKLNILH